MEKISVIMPIYNCEKYLKRSIESVLNQTYKKLELILINDGSTDNSLKVCREYEIKDDRVKVIDKENGGVSSSRNAGLEIATGEYVTFVDADDWIEPCMYEIMLKQFLKNKVEFVICNRLKEYIDGKKEKFYIDSVGCYNVEHFLEEIYRKTDIAFNVWNSVFKKDVINNVKFDENIALAEDNLFILEVLMNCNNGEIIDDCLYHYVQHENSANNQRIITEISMSSLIADKRQLEILKEKDKELYNYCRNMLIRDAVNISKKIIANKQHNREWEKRIKKIIRNELLTGITFNKNVPEGIIKNAICIAISFNVYRKIYGKYIIK